MDKLIVGQKFWLVDCGNRARYKTESRECIVTKVGRKYFTITYKNSPDSNYTVDVQFEIETFYQKTNYCQDYKIYSSEQEYKEVKLVDSLSKDIREFFLNYYNYNKNGKIKLEDLKKIAYILNIHREETNNDED